MLIPALAALFLWTNCIGNQSCYPSVYREPSSLEELCAEIQTAVSQGSRVRAVGNGYSISDVACTDGRLLNLKQLDRILAIDAERRTVRVEAGIPLGTLNERLAAHGLALPNQAAIDGISLGGAVSTAVHGTGHTASLSNFIREIELVTADGLCQRVTMTTDPDAFAAASVSLGALGVIYAVTLQCEPLFYLRPDMTDTTIERVIAEYDDLRQRNDFFQFTWNVETGRVATQQWNRCEPRAAGALPSYKALAWYTIDESDRDLFSEIAVPLASLPAALGEIQELAKRYRAAGATLSHLNVRFVEQDEHALLSPASDGPVACIAFSLLEGEKYLSLYRDFERAMAAHQGRLHWGKTHFLTRETASNLYGIKLERFAAVKKRLDPKGVFSNAFTDRLFGQKGGL